MPARSLKRFVPTAVRRVLGRTRTQLKHIQARRLTPEQYWTRHHVDSPDAGLQRPKSRFATIAGA